jgi:hypothetical protein
VYSNSASERQGFSPIDRARHCRCNQNFSSKKQKVCATPREERKLMQVRTAYSCGALDVQREMLAECNVRVSG